MDRLAALRRLISEHQLDGYLVTDSDNHYTFYSLACHDRRINWITQCQAQCGLALVTLNHGAVFESPPNYRFLVRKELDDQCWLIVDNLFEWILQNESNLGTIGYDPHRTPLFMIRRLANLPSDRCRFRSISSSTNWIDSISEKETLPSPHTLTPIWSLDEVRFAGQTSQEKIQILPQVYLRHNGDTFTLVATALDEIAWLLNLRANDMECNPLFYSFMIVSVDQLILFTDNPHQVLMEMTLVQSSMLFICRIFRTIFVHTMHSYLFFQHWRVIGCGLTNAPVCPLSRLFLHRLLASLVHRYSK